ncbi:MAG: hypothetical protein H0X33_14780 [Taibaiella sp.]|nr:hypothetical protein [Taibaiella sp.]
MFTQSSGSFFTGNAYLAESSDTVFSFGGLGVIDAMVAGNYISFGGNTYLMTAVGFNPTTGNTYTVTIGAGGLSSGTFGFEDFVVSNGSGTLTVENFECVSCSINVNSDGSDILDSVLTRELIAVINVPKNSTFDHNTLLPKAHDDWKVTVTQDGVPVFDGFLIPDEGPIPFHDKPYEVTLHASDGLKLLSGQSLTRLDGTEFNDKHTLIEYIAAILNKTLLKLPIKIYCNIYFNPMLTRTDDIKWDMFSQVLLDYRTFMNSSASFVDCYTALGILFKNHFRVYYDQGQWVIYRIPEFQFLATPDRYYTLYSADGATFTGGIDGADYAKVGKQNIVRAINNNQTQYARLANKSVRHSFQYTPWDEIPRNNKFERGILDTTAANTSTQKFFIISDWEYGHRSTLPLVTPLPSTSDKAWRKSTYNIYGIEVDREILLKPPSSGGENILLSKSIPVNQSDKINITFDVKTVGPSGSGPASYFAAYVFIKTASGPVDYYYLINNDTNNPSYSFWGTVAGAGASPVSMAAFYTAGADVSKYVSVNVDSSVIPVDGDLFIALVSSKLFSATTDVYFKNVVLTYYPYVIGGYIPVKGDYWQRDQTTKYLDSFSEEVFISDSPMGAIKGALWYGNLPVKNKTVPDWWRYGLGGSEIRHYKELVNMGVWNLTYRRFRRIEGEWDGTTYQVNSDSSTNPVSPTPRYGFEDLSGTPLFAIVCPIKIDMWKGRFTATFIEVYASSADGTQEGTPTFKYLFA